MCLPIDSEHHAHIDRAARSEYTFVWSVPIAFFFGRDVSQAVVSRLNHAKARLGFELPQKDILKLLAEKRVSDSIGVMA